MEKQFSEKIEKYFELINKSINKANDLAKIAKQKGLDPSDKVEIPLVADMAGRVEGLISVVAPQIIGSGVRERIKGLEEEYGSLDWRISLTIALEIAQQKFCKFKDKKEAIEIGIRAGFAYLTMGVVASPLEGFVGLTFRKTRDGKEYFAIKYSGPIRSAGGTGASVSVLIIDYVRKHMGYASYDPSEEEVKRMVTEIYDFHERITNLQYLPSEKEIEFLVRNIPVQIDGDPSEKLEVSNYKDLDRIDTNNIRNGICLVLAEGIAQKAPKIWKQLDRWGKEFELDQWTFMKDFVSLQKDIKAKGNTTKNSDSSEEKIKPDYTFIKDLVAGRPVFTHPLATGGFRLRYGRSRTSGFSSNSINSASMYLVNQYMAAGTQLKMERPGKACTLTSCDTLEGPIVRLKDGTVLQINTLEDAKKYHSKVEKIIFLGDMLINYGDFFNRAHKLVPPGYCQEWWIQEIEKKTVELFGNLDIEKLADLSEVDSSTLHSLFKDPLRFRLNVFDALQLSKKIKIPLDPQFSYYWKTVSKQELITLIKWTDKKNLIYENDKLEKITLPLETHPKIVLENLGIPHLVTNKEYVVIHRPEAIVLNEILKLSEKDATEVISEIENLEGDTLHIVNTVSDIFMRDKAGLFVGARMGRPEKAKMRQLTGSPQVLFPVGEEGGRFRCFQSALEAGIVKSNFSMYSCQCGRKTIYRTCEVCGQKAGMIYFCRTCGEMFKEECPKHGKNSTSAFTEIDIKQYFNTALRKLGFNVYPDLIKGVRGTSNKDHIPENIAKGILRAKHSIYVNKDGTTRYDMTQQGMTHFKPKEIGTSVDRLKEIGYEKDIYGNFLESDNQILEIFPQDVVLPSLEPPMEGADKVLFRVGNFIDELLEKFYGVEPFYNFKNSSDLVGHIVLCLAPHTSAAIVGRIIGFSKMQGFFAHPLLHAATRRDLDGDEACVLLLMDGLLNFSRQFLPAHRGSTQDAPLILTSTLTPAEVDDMVFDMDVMWKYPLEFYESCMEYKNPWEVKFDQISSRLGKPSQYEGMGFTHDTDNINETVVCSAYKTLPSMEEKLMGQMDIAQKVRAVTTGDVARLIVEKHFIRDTKGNLRKFSQQQFRCVDCNEKFRRPPLIGVCTKCKGKIIFTISEGSVIKYLEHTKNLVTDYEVPEYLRQTVFLLQKRIECVFGKEKEKQTGLTNFF